MSDEESKSESAMDNTEDKPKSDAPTTANGEPLHGVLAEYHTPKELLAAAEKIRDAGYTVWDTYSPFPVPGIEKAQVIPWTILPWLGFGAGCTGLTVGLGMQLWTNGVDYKYLISGKPFFSIAANIPITFEITVLFSALTAFGGMLALNRLPKPSHALDHVERFNRVTDDRFFALIEATDPKFDDTATRTLIAETSPHHVEDVPADTRSENLPKFFTYVAAFLALTALIPLGYAYSVRGTTSTQPRIHIVPDMDFQQKFKPQRGNPFFEDGRAMRPQIEGTVASGDLQDDSHFYRGKVGKAWARTFPSRFTPNEAAMQRGRERYDIFCVPCHSVTGNGSGIVAQHALELAEGTWIPPTNLTLANIKQQPVGELYNTITHGIRNMPAYGSQIDPEDRWAIVLYVRALQRAQAGNVSHVPAAKRAGLK